LLLLAGCQTRAPLMSPAGLEPVLVKGRLSVTGLSINPNFSLEQVDAAQQRLNISGAFGLGAIEVLYFKGTVQRGLVDQIEMNRKALQAAFFDATGLDVPLSVVPAWMLGQPHSRYRSQRTATGFEQLGWRIAVSQDDALGRPRRIEAVKGETKVILGIKLWQ
jgi:outer membrane biogenesis lipoprotein LolB